MGKALIISEQGEGEYTATLQLDTKRAEDTLALLDEKITKLISEIVLQKIAVLAAKDLVDAILNDLNVAIDSSDDLSVLTAITTSIKDVSLAYGKEKRKLNALKLDKLTAEKRRAFISSNLPSESPQTIWCSDYTQGLTGEVGTVEINGEIDITPIIYPGGVLGTDSNYSAARDNQVQPIISSGAPAVYFNKAILPGWQKWQPTFRLGEITALTGDSCNVSLDVAISSQQSMDINQAKILSSVTIDYMDSNGLLFEVGDRVVVQFEDQDWTQPKVIGFEDHPRPEYQLFILNDIFHFGTNKEIFINRYNLLDEFQEKPFSNMGLGYSRNLERVGAEFFWFSQTAPFGTTKRQIMKNNVVVASNSEQAFAVNKSYLFTHKYTTASYDRTIYRRYHQGSIVNSFQAVIPGKSLSDEIPFSLGANEDYLYIAMNHDPANNGSDYITRYDLDGSNPVNLIEFSYSEAPANSSATWRYMRVTKDRIYIPFGDTSEGQPVYCKVYDSNNGAYVGQFGPLPQSSDYLNPSYEEALACAANEKYFVWLYDDRTFGYFSHIWERDVTRNESGVILTEAFTKLPPTWIDLNGSDFKGCLGGLSL